MSIEQNSKSKARPITLQIVTKNESPFIKDKLVTKVSNSYVNLLGRGM